MTALEKRRRAEERAEIVKRKLAEMNSELQAKGHLGFNRGDLE